jgi:hypothetical protein
MPRVRRARGSLLSTHPIELVLIEKSPAVSSGAQYGQIVRTVSG